MKLGVHLNGLMGFIGRSWRTCPRVRKAHTHKLLGQLSKTQQATIPHLSTAFSAQWATVTGRAVPPDHFPILPHKRTIGLWLGPVQHDCCSPPAPRLPRRQPRPAVELLSGKDLKAAQKSSTPGTEQDGFLEHWSKRMEICRKHFLQVFNNYHLYLQELFPQPSWGWKHFKDVPCKWHMRY